MLLGPYPGLVASSDSHNGTPGATLEDDFPGHVGSLDAMATSKLSGNSMLQNPGGLMVVCAEENSRDSLFDAMLRRQTLRHQRYPRGSTVLRRVRPAGRRLRSVGSRRRRLCVGRSDGGLLAADPSASSPGFVVHALQDPGTLGFPGTPLAEIEIVKGWVEASGVEHEIVFSIGGGRRRRTPSTC